MEWLGYFFQDFFSEIYSMMVQFSAWIVVKFAVSWVEFKIFMLTFSWDVAREILINIQFSELISSSFNSLPPMMKGILLYIHFDKGLAIMTQAFVTRFLLNIMGW